MEFRDHFQLVAVPNCKVMFGYDRIKARQAVIDLDNSESEPLWEHLDPDSEVWAVMRWYEFEDGHQERGDISFIRLELEKITSVGEWRK